MQNVLAEHEMFEKFGGGETSKQGQAVETSSCQTNNVGQFRQPFIQGFNYTLKSGKDKGRLFV